MTFNILKKHIFVVGMISAYIKIDAAKRTKRRYKKMKTGETAKKGLYIGVGAGLVLFALVGFLPGSFIGGVVGLNVAGSIFGLPVTASVLPRIIVGASMVLGVMFAGVVFVAGGAMAGWLTGNALEAVRNSAPTEVAVKAQTVKVR
jgi:hypothetical protein